MNELKVEIKTFEDLCDYELSIPDFQRSYVWKQKNFEKLIDDLTVFEESNKQIYYMGTILLYEENGTFEIIDGQQRITTLSIMYYQSLKKLPSSFKLNFSSQQSINNISNAKKFFTDPEIKDDWFSKLQFTVITTTSQDEAFTFFDTQNSSGVKLKAIDLLKAHHLRAIKENEKQRVSAKKWEKIENYKKGFIRKNSDYIDELFKYILYRSRVWRGNQKNVVKIESNDYTQNKKIQEEFERGIQSDLIKLYPHHKNMMVYSIDIDENEDYILDFRWKQYRHKPKDIPFSIRQPISKGLEFFLFVEKYAQIVEYLLSDSYNTEFKSFYENVIKSLSPYIQEFFILCIVTYYDKFENEKLYEFSLWLEYFIGALRIKQSTVVEKSIPLYIRDEFDHNIIDIIHGAYTVDEVISFLKENKKDRLIAYYSFENIKGTIDKDSVRDKYKKNILNYYNQELVLKTLKEKRIWIEEKVKYVN